MQDHDALICWCEENLEELGKYTGSSRRTFVNPCDPFMVIKVPHNQKDYAYGCQMKEISVLKSFGKYPFMPRFHAETIHFDDGTNTPIIHMERLQPLENEDPFYTASLEERPAWTMGAVDGCQVGRNHIGTLKLYDLGHGFDASTANFIGTREEYYNSLSFSHR